MTLYNAASRARNAGSLINRNSGGGDKKMGLFPSIEKNEFGKEIYVFDPYNPLNKEIGHKDIETILQTYGINIPITNINLYRRAFINKSYLRRPELKIDLMVC